METSEQDKERAYAQKQDRIRRNTVTALRKIFSQASSVAKTNGFSECDIDTVVIRAFVDVIVQQKMLHIKAHHVEGYNPFTLIHTLAAEVAESVEENWTDMNLPKKDYDS
jgi:hypothetical protein